MLFPSLLLTHLLQRVSTIEQVLDILGHDLGHVLQLVVESAEIVGCARILICFLRALDEAIELGVLVRSKLRVVDFISLVRRLELCADILKVCKSKLLGI